VKEMFFTARQVSAREAGHMGLVSRVVPATELEIHVRDMCAMIAETASATIGAVARP
jgi:enoyl-CoA hydratase/carnithine racemase